MYKERLKQQAPIKNKLTGNLIENLNESKFKPKINSIIPA